MIVIKRKPLEEILGYIEGHDKILVLGCQECPYGCATAGGDAVKRLAEEIKNKMRDLGKSIEILEKTLIRLCELRYVKGINDLIKEVKAVVTLSCGVGVNLIADIYSEIEVYPGMNTLFLGAELREGIYIEKCRACGDCIVGYTAGLCPITRCPKNMLNGPCGGSKNGVCEVRKGLPCVWYQIIKRLKKRGKLEKLMEIWEAKDWRSLYGEGVRELREGLRVGNKN
ncbi:MAG: 5 10-methylenetetrahydrofolate reductase [Thermodesulfobacterium sp.]|uniref:5 10-methylenetetrahydrofolate reductase n=1 Tax=Candidatus Thermodesulfobacterium syntrophicum TaxID=3060442 RepID=A0AAE3TFF5_9BACT|nr:5 10-methylenetetrahydrofolate reductase [Candidatus Thermodesulfobacterium syntrophicum]